MIRFTSILLLAACTMMAGAQSGFVDTQSAVKGVKKDPAVLENPQGLAQQDLSIRGSSYADAGLFLNGLNLKVPYSAHYNAALPLFPPLLSDAQARTGLHTISGHLIGSVSMNTQPLQPGYTAQIGLGTVERYSASVFSSTENVGGYLDWEKARQIDYDLNDLDRMAGGVFLQHLYNDWQFDIIAIGQSKEYGAQGYFGIPANVYAEEQTYDSLLTAGAFKGDREGSFIRAGFNLREFENEYRIPSANFLSDVVSRYGSAMIEGRTLEIQHIALNLRGDLEHERISGDLGGHSRTRGAILILPEARFERVTVTAGINSVSQSDESPEWLPQVGVDFHATDNTKVYFAHSETIMQPDYQSLYYTDPYRSGNPALKLQHSRTAEIGLQQFLSAKLDWRTAAFHRRQKNARDWIRPTIGDADWSATDLGILDVTGIEILINYLMMNEFKVQLYYQWIEKDDYDFYAGLYELDYPEHLLNMSGFWQITPELQLFGSQTLRKQTDHAVRSGRDFGAEASLGLHYAPRFAKNMRLSLMVENLWDTDFQAIPGLRPRPLSVSTGLTVHW